MKLVTVIALWTLITTFSVSLHAEGLRLSEPVAEDASSETFGSPLDEGLTPITLGQALAEPAKYFNQTVAVETKVGKVCQKKGCFFIAQQGSNSMRVSFKDYSFFVPTNISGQTVT